MENNRNTLIIVALVSLIALFLFKYSIRTEGYQRTQLPFDTEGTITHPFGLDKFYQGELEGRAAAQLGAYRTDSEIPPPSTVCSNTLKKRQRDGKYKNCCQKCMESLKEQENTTKIYYQKFRNLQNRVADLENALNFNNDVIRQYKKKLGFCKRELTLNPVVQKCHGNYKLAPNSISGLGVETQFKL